MKILATIALLVALLVSASLGYAARDTHTMKHWHPMFVEPALGYFGWSFFGHEHTRHEHPVKGGAFIDAPITSCWNYDFLERDCDGPDHYKAYLADGSRPNSMIGAYDARPRGIMVTVESYGPAVGKRVGKEEHPCRKRTRTRHAA